MDKGTPQTHPSDEWVALERLTQNIALRKRIAGLEAEVARLEQCLLERGGEVYELRADNRNMSHSLKAAEAKLAAVGELPAYKLKETELETAMHPDPSGTWIKKSELAALLKGEGSNSTTVEPSVFEKAAMKAAEDLSGFVDAFEYAEKLRNRRAVRTEKWKTGK